MTWSEITPCSGSQSPSPRYTAQTRADRAPNNAPSDLWAGATTTRRSELIAGLPRRKILDVEICALSAAEASAMVCSAGRPGVHLKLAFANAHMLNLAYRHPDYRRALETFVVLPDGAGVDLASLITHGAAFPANLNGTDFIPALLAQTRPQRWKVRLIGARPGVAERAVASLRRLAPHDDIAALSHGFIAPEDLPALLARLTDERPDLLLVAMGNPLQELWIAQHITSAHAGIVAGVGALFDFLSGDTPRAPRWLRRPRLEWVHRLVHEPNRLWRRYLLGNPLFIWRVLTGHAQQRRARR